jgi:hypothetical protein
MAGGLKNLFNKLMGKLGFMPVSSLETVLKVFGEDLESTKRWAKLDLAERDKTIQDLRDQLRHEQRVRIHNDALDADLNVSRFIAITDMDGVKRVRKVTEDQISRAIDMADCYDDNSQYLYLDDDGKFYPVSFGGVSRHVSAGELDEFYAENPTIIFSQSGAMVANGKTVGYVSYTDH